MCTALSSANSGASKITTQHITNRQDKWLACGINCNIKVNHFVATWDDKYREAQLGKLHFHDNLYLYKCALFGGGFGSKYRCFHPYLIHPLTKKNRIYSLGMLMFYIYRERARVGYYSDRRRNKPMVCKFVV